MASVSALEFPAETARSASSRKRALGEFLLVGGATWLFLPIGYLLRAGLGFDDAELVVGFTLFHAAHVINNPHFAVTYLLFYRNLRERAFGASLSRTQRLRYVFAGLVVPLALGGFITFALARHSAHELGLVLQAMFVLVGWHYVKQSFGVLSVLSARRGVRFSLGGGGRRAGTSVRRGYSPRASTRATPAGKRVGRRRLHDARPSARARRAH
ncbi:MAG: hypothetical protein QM756_44060 [Polyangiaceae bacterium]